jgi:hypothetical protein
MKFKPISNLAILGLLLSLMTTGCYYDKAYELIPGTEPCDTVNYAFYENVTPILDQNCVECHHTTFAAGGVNLENYDGVKQTVNNGTLLGSIRHEQGFSPMPDGAPQLDPCTIRTIELWIDDGAPDN